jgi:hypothetical protein
MRMLTGSLWPYRLRKNLRLSRKKTFTVQSSSATASSLPAQHASSLCVRLRLKLSTVSLTQLDTSPCGLISPRFISSLSAQVIRTHLLFESSATLSRCSNNCSNSLFLYRLYLDTLQSCSYESQRVQKLAVWTDSDAQHIVYHLQRALVADAESSQLPAADVCRRRRCQLPLPELQLVVC